MSDRVGCATWQKVEADARAEAVGRPATGAAWERLVQAVEAARTGPGGDVLSHAICFDLDQWQPYAGVLPGHVLRARCVSRGDVFEIAAAPAVSEENWRLFCASYIWGHGANGYGKARLERITEATPAQQLRGVISEARARLESCGPLSAYAYLRGTGTACTIPNWGPAFFTKLLYFADTRTSPGSALILDNLTATAVGEISGLPNFVTRRGTSRRWTAYRYGVYLAWMNQAAVTLGITPDLLEYALFVQERDRKKRRVARDS